MDPVEGGSANDYDYANQDCVNNYDLDGRASRTNAWLNRFNKCMSVYKPLTDFYQALSFNPDAVADFAMGRGGGGSVGLRETARFANRQAAHQWLKYLAGKGVRFAKFGSRINPIPMIAGITAQGVMNGYCEIQALRGKTL